MSCWMQPTETPEKLVDVAHPLGVAAGEVVVGGDQLGVAAGERIQIERQRGHERLALAGGHLGDLPLVQGNAADQLDVIVHHVPRQLMVAHRDLAAVKPACRALHSGKGLRQQLVEGLARLEPIAKLSGLRLQLFIAERLVGKLELVDADDDRPAPVEELAIMAAGKLLKEPGNHEKRLKLSRPDRAWQMANPRPRRRTCGQGTPGSLSVFALPGCLANGVRHLLLDEIPRWLPPHQYTDGALIPRS